MKYAHRSLAHTIVTLFDIELDGVEFSTIYSQTLSYLTKGIGAFDFQHAMKPYCKGRDFSAKDYRLKLHETRYVSLHLKVFMLRLSLVKSIDLDFVKALAEELEIRVKDAKRMVRVWEQHPALRRRLKAEAKAIPAERHELLTMDGIDRYFREQVYSNLMRYIKFFVYKKLRFLSNANNDTFADLQNDVLEKCVQAYYGMVPLAEYTDLHMKNSLNQTAHNHVLNIIEAGTRLKSGRIAQVGIDANGNPINELIVASENQQRLTGNGEDEDGGEQTGILKGVSHPMEKFELEFSISEIMNRLQAQSKKHRVLKILMGNDDPQFTGWLIRHKHCKRSETNYDLQLRVDPAAFNEMLAQFLQVEKKAFDRFLKSLRVELGLPPRKKKVSQSQPA